MMMMIFFALCYDKPPKFVSIGQTNFSLVFDHPIFIFNWPNFRCLPSIFENSHFHATCQNVCIIRHVKAPKKLRRSPFFLSSSPKCQLIAPRSATFQIVGSGGARPEQISALQTRRDVRRMSIERHVWLKSTLSRE